MQNSESIQDFLTRVMGIVNEITSYGEDSKYQKIVEKILRILPAKFDAVVVVVVEPVAVQVVVSVVPPVLPRQQWVRSPVSQRLVVQPV